jgi:hypothetical protein
MRVKEELQEQSEGPAAMIFGMQEDFFRAKPAVMFPSLLQYV